MEMNFFFSIGWQNKQLITKGASPSSVADLGPLSRFLCYLGLLLNEE